MPDGAPVAVRGSAPDGPGFWFPPTVLAPVDPGNIVLGASSDHLIVDMTDSSESVEIGTEVRFWPTYAGLLATATSSAVWKAAATPHRL